MIVTLLVLVALLLGGVAGWALATARAGRGGAARTAETAAFLDLADQRLAPVRDALGGLDAQLRGLEASRRQAYGGLLAQVEGMREAHTALRAETGSLVTALRAPQTRGRWGEMTLRRVVESAGAVEHCHFTEQMPLADGRLRPDLVVHLADGKHVVVDSKAPFTAYLDALEARDETTRTERRRAHARQLREHVRALGDKSYWEALEGSPELVVLFVPADSFLDAALQEDPSLLDDAFARDVVLATPSTLVALLRTVAHCWRTEKLAANTAEVGAVGRELYDRLSTLGGHVDRLGSALGRAVGAYNEALGSLESRVFVSARRLADLDVGRGPVPAPGAVDAAVRPITAPELLGGPRPRSRASPDHAAA